MRTRPSIVALLSLVLLEGVAWAQVPPAQPAPAQQAAAQESPAQKISVKEIIGGTVNRARRAVAFGPTIGVLPAYLTNDTGFDGAVTFGLGIYVFKVPIIPGPDEIRQIIQDRVKAKFEEKLKAALLHGEKPDKQTLEQWGREIYEEVKAEVLGQMNVRAQTIEKPKFVLDLEGEYLLRAEFWDVRTTFGIGVKSLTFGPTLVLRSWDAVGFSIGGELGYRFCLSKSPRSPVLNVFLRMDFEVADRDVRGDEASLGVRFLLDII